MTNRILFTSIENYIEIVAEKNSKAIPFILSKYNAKSIDDLNPCYYLDVFNELHSYVTEI